MSGNIGKPLQHPANDAELGKRDSAESSSSGSGTLSRWDQAKRIGNHFSHFHVGHHTGHVLFDGPKGFITKVHQESADGKVHHWDARRHRRNKLPATKRDDGTHDSIDPSNPFRLNERHIEADKRALRKMRMISFWVGPTFFIGSVLFILGAAAACAPGYFEGSWSTGLTDGLVNAPYVAGAAFYAAGCYAAILEVANVNYRTDVRNYVDGRYDGAHRKSKTEPRIDLLPFPTHTEHAFISYYGAQIQYLGAWIYVMGTCAQLAASHLGFTETESYIWVVTPYAAGGVCFIVGAVLMAAEAAHSWVWAWLPPPPSRIRDIGRWIEFIDVVGSFLFFVGGVLGYYTETGSLVGYQVITAICFVFAAFLFLIQSVLLTLEWFYPKL